MSSGRSAEFEAGQATVEYVLLLAVLMVVVVAVTRGLIIPLGKKTADIVQRKFEQQFKDRDGMHRLVLPL